MSDIKISQMQPWVGAVTGNIEIPAVFANENYRIAFSQMTPSTFGFGNMALQNSNAVQITGGSVAVTALSGAITIENGGTGLAVAPGIGQVLIGTGTAYALSTLTAGAGISISNAAGAITISATGVGAGTVTSVNVDGGTTGMTFSGGPITTSGTISMSGTLSVANGGTNATTASGARANLQAAKSGANSDITSITGLTTPLSVMQGGTGANDSLSGYIFGNGTNPFTSVALIPMSDLTGVLPIAKGGTNGSNVVDARSNLLPAYIGNKGKALVVNTAENDIEWSLIPGTGTVTSVNVSGGTTGLTTSGGPILSSGTITLGGTLNAVNGGTGLNTYLLGEMIYASSPTALTRIPANTTTTKKFLSQTGDGTASAAPTWNTVTQGDVGLGLVENVALSTWTGSSYIATVGTITAGTWNGSVVSVAYGGTGAATLTGYVKGNGTSAMTASATIPGTDISGDIAGNAANVTGTVITSNGGTGLTSYTAGDMVFYASGTALSKLALGASTYILTSSGSAPQWSDPTTITVGNATNAVNATNATNATNAVNSTNATTATNIAGGAAGSIPYQTAINTTALLAAGTGVLIGGSTPSYTMSPSLTQVTVAADPTLNLQVATKQYVDTLVASGITYHQPVKYEVPNTTGNLNATYNNGTAGVGATLTNAGTLEAFTPDGIVAQVGDRILVYNQTNQFENGVYEVTTVGSGSVAWVLTRTADADSYALKSPNGLGEGDAFFVTSGNTGAGETYACNTVGTITFGTTAITFAQISSAPAFSAGAGLTLTGNVFSITAPVATNLGGTGLTSFTSGGAVYATSTSALTTGTLPVTAGGTGQTSFADGELLIGNSTGNTLTKSTLTAGTGVSVTNGSGSITITNSAPDQVVSLTGSTGISTSGTYPNFTITNTSPDQVVVLTGGTGISTSGTYPNFTITNSAPDQVVSISAGAGISATGTYPNFTITNSAPDQVVSLTGGTNISITGTYPNFTISSAGGGTVTSVSGTGTVNGLTLTGTVTSAGSLTLGGTLTGVDLTTAVTGTLPVANGGTGAATLTGYVFGNGTSPMTAIAAIPGSDISGNISGNAANVTGIVAIANGGTNTTATPTNGGVAYGTGTAYAFTSAGTAGQVLVSNGTSAPTFGGVNGGTF